MFMQATIEPLYSSPKPPSMVTSATLFFAETEEVECLLVMLMLPKLSLMN